MTIAATTTFVRYVRNGTATQWSYPNKIFAAADLIVTDLDAAIPPVAATLVPGTDYTVQNIGADTGCQVTTTVPGVPGHTLDIRSSIAPIQISYGKNQGTFLPALHENAFDHATRLVQDLMRRAYCFGIHGPDTEGVLWPALPGASLRANTQLIFDVNGLPNLGTPTAGILSTGSLAPYLALSRTTAEAAAGVTPANLAYPPGAFRRYGISPAVVDNGPLLNQALLCNSIVHDDDTSGPNIYPIQTTVRFQSAGQILRGQGFGDNNLTGAFLPRTTLKWTGADGGAMVSVFLPTAAPSAVHWSGTQLRDLVLDGNSAAAIGYEGYNNSVTTGAFRNQVVNCGIVRVSSSAGAVGAFMGAGTVNANSNDYVIDNCFIQGCSTAVQGGGATQNLRRTTISGNQLGLKLTTGAMCTTTNCVFSSNGQDIAADQTQQYADFGSWFENSSVALYGAATSHNASFHGSLLHTFNTAQLISWNNAAGNASLIGCFVPGTSNSNKVTGHNASYEYCYEGTDVAPDFIYRARYPATGADRSGLVRADNADFLCGITDTTAAMTGDGTFANLNLYPVTVDHDCSQPLSALTPAPGIAPASGIFTAPAGGYYSFDVHTELGGITASHNDAQLNLVIAGTSAQVYFLSRSNPCASVYAASAQCHLGGSMRVFMTKGDTAHGQIEVGGGAKVVTVLSGGPTLNWRTRFAGRLA